MSQTSFGSQDKGPPGSAPAQPKATQSTKVADTKDPHTWSRMMDPYWLPNWMTAEQRDRIITRSGQQDGTKAGTNLEVSDDQKDNKINQNDLKLSTLEEAKRVHSSGPLQVLHQDAQNGAPGRLLEAPGDQDGGLWSK